MEGKIIKEIEDLDKQWDIKNEIGKELLSEIEEMKLRMPKPKFRLKKS